MTSFNKRFDVYFHVLWLKGHHLTDYNCILFKFDMKLNDFQYILTKKFEFQSLWPTRSLWPTKAIALAQATNILYNDISEEYKYKIMIEESDRL